MGCTPRIISSTVGQIQSEVLNGDPSPSPSPSGTSQHHYFLYVANYGDGTLSNFQLDALSGVPTALAQSSVSLGGSIQPHSIAITPNGKYLYVSDVSGTNKIFGFSIDPSAGTLTALAAPFVIAGGTPRGITIDPSGRFLYSSDPVNFTTFGFSIDSQGALSPINSGNPFQFSSVCCNSISFDPLGRFLYAPGGFGTQFIGGYGFSSSDGSLSNISPSGDTGVSGSDPVFVTFDPLGNYLYSANWNGSVSVFSMDGTTGELTNVGGASTGTNSNGIAVSPNGENLYVSNFGDDSISIIPLGGGGASLGSPQTLATGNATGPITLAFAPFGSFLYVLDYSSSSPNGAVQIFQADESSGALSPASTASVPTGQYPYAIGIVETSGN